MENEQRTYGIADWAAELRAKRTEKELAAVAAANREVRVRKNVRSDRESIEVPTRHEEVSVERVFAPGCTDTPSGMGVATYRG